MNISQKLKSIIRDIPDFPKEGILFKDITPIMLYPEIWNEITTAIIEDFKEIKIDAIAGIESRGFLFGPLLAQKLGVPFILIRKKGKLPGETYEISYDLEYGSATLEVHKDAITPNHNILIHDDLLATGGTVEATSELVHKLNCKVAGYSFLVELEFLKGRLPLTQYSKNISTLVRF